jgi:hypothetical protein
VTRHGVVAVAQEVGDLDLLPRLLGRGLAQLLDFPVTPGAEMPKIEGCSKQDYAVLFVLGEEV